MLDESFRDEADLRLAVELRAATHVNVRISKCGGLIASARLAALARSAGLGCQLGVQVGEVGPLWAAGRTLGCALAGLRAAETGRQDEWFREPLTVPAFAVDRHAQTAHPLPGPGCGVVPSARLLRDVPHAAITSVTATTTAVTTGPASAAGEKEIV
jgi:L-alanine-DL-glutamate epimerase-like enolase superfamily enzyme